jgi:hypothetical protein
MGQSFLSSIVISEVKPSSSTTIGKSQTESVAYSYIKEDDLGLHDTSNLLKSLAYQIAIQDPLFWQHAVRCSQEVESTATPRQIWQNFFINYFLLSDLPACTRIILDSLDEYKSGASMTWIRYYSLKNLFKNGIRIGLCQSSSNQNCTGSPFKYGGNHDHSNAKTIPKNSACRYTQQRHDNYSF